MCFVCIASYFQCFDFFTRRCYCILPVPHTCRAFQNDIIKCAREMLPPYFHVPDKTLQVRFTYTVYGKTFERVNFHDYKTKPPFAGKASCFTCCPIRATIDTKHMAVKLSLKAKKTWKPWKFSPSKVLPYTVLLLNVLTSTSTDTDTCAMSFILQLVHRNSFQ